jgi:putative tryptophan/tyrosine transport system substrate-binding protein
MSTRRDFITLLGGAAAAWPLAAQAQQPAMPVIGWLSMRSASDSAFAVAAVRRGLSQTGHVEGRNVAIEFHWLENNHDRLPLAVTELVARQVAVIAVIGSAVAALAAKSVTDNIPIVFANGGDPVQNGLVPSLNRPGGNLTGATFLTVALGAKRLEFLHELVPRAAVIAMLAYASRPDADSQISEAQAATRAMGLQLRVFTVRTEAEIEPAFTAILQYNPGGLLVGTDPFFTTQRHRLAALAARHLVPAIYSLREYAEAGGLMSYGASLTEAFHQVGIYTGRILKGEKPGDLPVIQPTKFELVINLKTAKALGLEVPPTLLARADEVIE